MIEILYSEYDATHRGDFKFDIPEGLNSWLLLMIQTPAIVHVDDRPVKCPANTALLYKPYQKILYEADDKRFTNDWIMFNTDELFITETNLPLGRPLQIDDFSYIHNLFRLITMEREHNGDYTILIIRKLLQILFYKLSEYNIPRNHSEIINDIYDLRREIMAKPELNWSLSMMADKLSISTGYLQTAYKEAFSRNCMEDVILSRIEKAKKYLSSSNLSLSEIVSACGYRSPEHFFRQFKKMTGMTPRSYRLRHSYRGGLRLDDLE